MSFNMSDSEILGALENAASEISRRIQQGLFGEEIDRPRGGDRLALGPESVEQAAREGGGTRFLSAEASSLDYADHLIGAVFEQGGGVEEISVEEPNLLDTEGRGVAARLRYDLEHSGISGARDNSWLRRISSGWHARSGPPSLPKSP